MNTNLTHNKLHVMHDLETIGTKPGCVVLSIGATIMFSPADKAEFYCAISADSCKEVGMIEEYDTLKWWEKQSEGVRNAAFSGVCHIQEALEYYADWLHEHAGPRAICVWGNGASFDSPVLAAAYRICGMPTPWDFRNEYCYRTMKNLYPQLPYIPPLEKHHALEDARAQAAHLERIMAFLNTRGGI